MASGTVARINVQVGANIGPLQKDMARATGVVTQFGSSINGIAARMAGLFGGISAAGLAGWGVRLAAEMEMARVSMVGMTGSAEAAESVLAGLWDFAAKTPFEFPEVRQAGRTLLAMGTSAQDVVGQVRMLGDVAAGSQQPLNELAQVFGQVMQAGRLTGNELRQFNERGVPLMTQLAQNLGVTKQAIRDMVEEGAISSEMVVEAFRSMTSEGGLFFRMTELQGKTLSGRWSTLKDNAGALARQFGEVLMPALERLVTVGSGLLDWLQRFDATTVENTVKIGLWVGSITAAIVIFPRIVAGIRSIIAAYQALSVAQSIQQALSGPRGWAVLAAGLVVAAGAAVAINAAFAEVNSKLDQQTAKAQQAGQAVRNLAAETRKAAEAAKAADFGPSPLEQLANRVTEANESPIQKARREVQDANLLFSQGLITLTTYQREIARIRDEWSGAMRAREDYEEVGQTSIGAVTRNSSAGFSAVQSAQSALQRTLEREAKANEETARNTAESAEFLRLISESIGQSASPEFVVASF